MKTDIEILIIGGGPAGMSAALTFGGSYMKTIIVNKEQPRNNMVKSSFGFLSRDGEDPKTILSEAKRQLEKYDSITYLKDEVLEVSKEQKGFLVKTLLNGNIFCKRIVFASGLSEDIGNIGINGLEEVYGKSVFSCPFCHGWQVHKQPMALFGNDSGISHFTRIIKNWTDDLIIFTNGERFIDETIRLELKRNGVEVIENEIDQLVSQEGKLFAVRLSDNTVINRTAGFIFNTNERQASLIPISLGVQLMDWGIYETNEWGKSLTKNVYVIGDAKNGFSGFATASHEGYTLAKRIVKEIIDERWVS